MLNTRILRPQTMPPNPNDTSRSVFRSLGISLICCCTAVGVFLLFERTNQNDNRWFGQMKPDFRTIPPEWITYQQMSVFACPVQGQPTCFALWGDSTFVIGTAKPHALSFFDEKGILLRQIDLPEEPKAIACAADKIVVAHPNTIIGYDVEGKREFSWKLPQKKRNIQSLVITPKDLFAADTGNRCIYRFNAEGDIDLTFAFRSFVVFASPITMTFSPADDLLYITNPGKHRVEVFTRDGTHKPELSFGEPSGNLSGFVGCCNPIGLAVLDDGRILTVEKSVSRIKIFGINRSLDCVVAGPSVLDDYPASLGRTLWKPDRYFAATVLSEGRIAVFDFDGQLIRVFAPHVP